MEAFYDGGVATALFGMPVLLAFTMGFILKAVGPGLVVPAMFQLQKTGLGKDQGARGRQDARVRGVGWAAAGRGWGWRRVCWAMRPHPVVETNPWPHPRPAPPRCALRRRHTVHDCGGGLV